MADNEARESTLKHLLMPTPDQHEPEMYERYKKFASRLKAINKQGLNEYFRKLDESRSTLNDSNSIFVSQRILTLLNKIAEAVGLIDERFKCTCIPSGSFYDGLKIDAPDEFDFVFEIEALSKPNIYNMIRSKRKVGFAYLTVTNQDIANRFSQFLCPPGDDEVLENVESIISVSELQSYFISLITNAFDAIELPKELTYGKESVNVVYHGPCATLKLTFDDSNIGQFVIDIDIAPAIRLTEQMIISPLSAEIFKIGVNKHFLDHITKMQNETSLLFVPFHFDSIEALGRHWTFHYADKWRISFCRIEKRIFDTFEPNSVEKQLLRVLKMFIKDNFRHSLDLMKDAGAQELQIMDPPSSFLTNVSVTVIGQGSNRDDYDDEDDDDDDDDDNTDTEIIYERMPEESSMHEEEILDADIINDRKVDESKEIYPNTLIKQGTCDETSHKNAEFIDKPLEPLISTYTIKMMFFYLKLASSRNWTDNDLSTLIFEVLDAFYFVFTSRQKSFLHFWFRSMIGKSTTEMHRMEILFCLDRLLDFFHEL